MLNKIIAMVCGLVFINGSALFAAQPSQDLMADSKFRVFIGQFQKLMKSTQQVSLDEARRQSTAFFCPPELSRESVHKVTDIKVTSQEGHEIPIRLYYPTPSKNLPIIIYYHRGGWVFSNIEEADPVCRKLANHLGCIIASVDYRLAPENPFPKPLNDCYDAFCWIAEHGAELGSDAGKVIVCGESVGGNLAAAVALRARDSQGPALAAQLLIYPVISATFNEKAYKESADQHFLTKEAMQFFWSMYLQNPADAKNEYASLDQASSLKNLPPALIVTAEHDPLHVEAEKYAEMLEKAGNHVILEKYPGVVHGFLDLPIYSDDEIVSWINRIGECLKKVEILKSLGTGGK